MFTEDTFWAKIRGIRKQEFPTLSNSKPGKNEVVDVQETALWVRSLLTGRGPRKITRNELYAFYRTADREPVMLKDIGEGGRLEHLRETLGGKSGSALLGLLLHTFPDELERANHGNAVGIRAKKRS